MSMHFALYCLSFLIAATAVAADSLYPENHFDHVTKILDEDHLNSFVQTQIDQGKTVFVRWVFSEDCSRCKEQAPSWNEVVAMFAGVGQFGVIFAEVNLEEADIKGKPHYPGSGGWPTIKYFTPETGTKGARYEKKTDLKVHEELGDLFRMTDYIEESGKTVLCDVDGKNCNEKEIAYLEKKKGDDKHAKQKQFNRLEDILEEPMKSELKEWVYRRLRILGKMGVKSESKHREKKKQAPPNMLDDLASNVKQAAENKIRDQIKEQVRQHVQKNKNDGL